MKNEIRVVMKEKLMAMSSLERVDQSRLILNKLEQNAVFKEANSVLLYWSLEGEIDTHNFIEKWSSTKDIYLPVIIDNKIYLKKYNKNMTIGVFGVMEPIGEIYTGNIDLAIVPGLAFDKNGGRLGRGKAYYDKLLSKLKTYKIGVCFPCQIIDEVPSDDWDIIMDEIVV